MTLKNVTASLLLFVSFGCYSYSFADSIILTQNLQWGGNDRDMDGLFEEIGVGTGERFFISYSPSIEVRAALEYDLGGIPNGSAITSAIFNVMLLGRGGSTGAPSFELNAYSGDGTQGGISFQSNTLVGGPFTPNNIGVVYSTDVTSFIDANEPGYLGLVFRAICSSCGFEFASQEYLLNTTWRPSLNITYTPAVVPLPATLYLFGSGLIAVLGLSKRTNQT